MKKRVLTLALALCLVLSLAAPVLAAESGYRVARISDGRAMYLYSFTYANGGTLPTAVDCTVSDFSQTMAFNDAGQVTALTIGSISTYTYSYDGDGNMTEALKEDVNEVQAVTDRTVNTWEGGLLMRTQNEHTAAAVNGSDAPEFSSTVTDEYSYDGGVCTSRTRTSVFDGQQSQVDVTCENDANGHPLRLTYSAPGWAPTEETFSYDEQGRVVSHTDTAGYTYSYTYAGPVQVEAMQIPLSADDPAAAALGGALWNVSIQMADRSGTVYFTDSVQTTGEPELVYDANGLLTALNCDYSGASFTLTIEYETADGALVGAAVAMPDDGYAAPTELGSDPLSMVFAFDGELYRLPVPFAAFAASGLELMSYSGDVPESIGPGESARCDFGRPLLQDRRGSMLLHNYGSAPAAPEDCYVVAVGVNYISEASSQIVIPEANGGIRSGMSREELDAIVGPSAVTYYVDETVPGYADYRVYLNEADAQTDPANCNIRIEYSDEKHAVDYIQVYYEPDTLPY